MKTIIRDGDMLDTTTMSLVPGQDILIEDGIITEIGHSLTGDEFDNEIDAKGKYVLPGFIDAHVHFRLGTLNFANLSYWTEVEFGIAMARLCDETIHRGFTTVRDTGGDLTGLLRAIRKGQIQGPDIIRSGQMISQTGGHGDVEGGKRAVPDCACQMRHTAMGIVADGPDAVRKAARHLLRDGSDFLKIHVSGGVASPSDPLECTQYTATEIQAVVQEAKNRKTYVTAHAYTPEAIQLAVLNGVKCIEHGNLLDEATAKLMVDNDVYLVPTLATYQAMDQLGEQLGLPGKNIKKNRLVLDQGLKALEIAAIAGVKIGWGTDLIGETQTMQAQEFAIRAQVQSASDILHAMYVVNPAILRKQDQIGALKTGMKGHVVITKVNPLTDITLLADSKRSVDQVILNGEVL